MLHDPNHLAEHIGRLLRIFDEAALKVAVNDVIGVVSHIWLAVLGSTQFGSAALELWKVLQPLEIVVPAELGDLDWQRICKGTWLVNASVGELACIKPDPCNGTFMLHSSLYETPRLALHTYECSSAE